MNREYEKLPERREMQIAKDAVLLRVFIGESDRYRHKPLYEQIVLKARELRLAGATVLRGPRGTVPQAVCTQQKSCVFPKTCP